MMRFLTTLPSVIRKGLPRTSAYSILWKKQTIVVRRDGAGDVRRNECCTYWILVADGQCSQSAGNYRRDTPGDFDQSDGCEFAR